MYFLLLGCKLCFNALASGNTITMSVCSFEYTRLLHAAVFRKLGFMSETSNK